MLVCECCAACIKYGEMVLCGRFEEEEGNQGRILRGSFDEGRTEYFARGF